MSESLEHLIERLQQEAVQEAESKARTIVSNAQEKARAIVEQAEQEKAAIIENGREEAAAYEERAEAQLHQASRDLLISVKRGIENILELLVAEAVDEAMTIDVLKQMLAGIAQSCAEKAGDHRLEFLLSPQDKEKLVAFFASRYREKMASGVKIRVDQEIEKGFKVAFKEGEVYLDFTNEAVAEALSLYLRPRLAEIVKVAARENDNAAGSE
ncbi:hypothetical protein DPQ33_16505 [Oceanidesulfovibrio indonesiensis]|jgi:V/A-type H+-transporting ATPase subunit E|uniref:V-type ATP synthase subunit E n=1 Tax=Oceanidesulfovibrio indonesiensis TaxID=54767 RepID=A0A7M3MAK2_9BACT|nr:hypothetical protein [Oceanidesulfovibrio indonesiensis]TVM14827.1 hypothetical protein DPQ33_16505 [Oceanidesulfovibrio indonesiensis]